MRRVQHRSSKYKAEENIITPAAEALRARIADWLDNPQSEHNRPITEKLREKLMSTPEGRKMLGEAGLPAD